MIAERNKISAASAVRPSVPEMVENIVGCKWSLRVLALVREGINRPGAMEHAVAGLTAKVLNERLRKLSRYGILDKTVYAESPPRVEYHLTEFGQRFGALLDQIEQLEKSLAESARPRSEV
jgi:DNA-binding HxlR family transcriptional regulator